MDFVIGDKGNRFAKNLLKGAAIREIATVWPMSHFVFCLAPLRFQASCYVCMFLLRTYGRFIGITICTR